jgi:hypothetical protein
MYVIPYKRDATPTYERCDSRSGPNALQLYTLHLLAESFPTSYRPKNLDKNCPKSIFSVWLLIGSDTQKSRVKPCFPTLKTKNSRNLVSQHVKKQEQLTVQVHPIQV